MLVDVVWFERIHADVRVIYNEGKLMVATLIHFWVDWLGHPGDTNGLPGHLGNPVLSKEILGNPCDQPMVCHPGSKGS